MLLWFPPGTTVREGSAVEVFSKESGEFLQGNCWPRTQNSWALALSLSHLLQAGDLGHMFNLFDPLFPQLGDGSINSHSLYYRRVRRTPQNEAQEPALLIRILAASTFHSLMYTQ